MHAQDMLISLIRSQSYELLDVLLVVRRQELEEGCLYGLPDLKIRINPPVHGDLCGNHGREGSLCTLPSVEALPQRPGQRLHGEWVGIQHGCEGQAAEEHGEVGGVSGRGPT